MRNKVFDNTAPRMILSKSCPLSGKDSPTVDYKNINLLKDIPQRKVKFCPVE